MTETPGFKLPVTEVMIKLDTGRMSWKCRSGDSFLVWNYGFPLGEIKILIKMVSIFILFQRKKIGA